MKQTAICIIGAHRSGTSMVTRLLHQCGLDLGRETDLMPAQADNPDGFWENLRFVAINDEVLNQLGGAWDLPPPVSETFAHPRLEPAETKARHLISEFEGTRVWGWKDPRTTITLPFWQRLLPKLKVLLVVRNPLEVAYSLRERNGTSYAFGLRLWEIYNRRALQFSKDSERLIAHYDSFFEDPRKELDRIVQFAGLPNDHVNEAAALVVARKRHVHFDRQRLIDARVANELIDLYQSLAHDKPTAATDFTEQADSASPADILPGASNRIEASVPDAEVIRRELAELRGAKIENRVALASRDARLREMEAQISRHEETHTRLATLVGRRETEIEKVRENAQAEIAKAREREETLRERFLQTNEILHRRSLSLSQQEQREVELIADLRHQLHATKRLLRLVDDTAVAAERLRKSRRWQIANPLSALKALFGGSKSFGYGHLEKIVKEYSAWRAAHPEAATIKDALQALKPRAKSEDLPARPNESECKSYQPAAPMRPIEFDVHEQVEISIIIPVYNQLHFTLACLASLQKHQNADRFEVIVVDDCSSDATPETVAQLPGVIYLRNETNSGFIASCNYGASQARGEFLVFLNNDTEVTAGWLGSLRQTFAAEPKAGLVGSKLIFPDGRLQEAGGIIWRDASGWNRGKGYDASKPEFNFLREVDYCSAASVMIPKALFQTLGGFDSKYAPCYYEDTDLAFRVRRHGLKVLYQPASEVIHYEGATSGTDLSSGAKRYQEINRETFRATWAVELAEKPENGDLATHEQLASGFKRILVIDHHLPMPDRDSGSVRMSQILRILRSLGHHVTFLPDNLADLPPYTRQLQKVGIEVIHHPYAESIRGYLQECGAKFDVVILSRCDFAEKYIADVRRHAPRSRVIFDTVDLHFVRTQSEANLRQDETIESTARAVEAREFALIDEADETWVVSECERQVLLRARPQTSVEVVSNIVEAPGSATPFLLRGDFLFIGSFQHPPNVDAVLYFTTEIYPLVQRRLPKARFYIIGDKAPPEVIALANESIIVTGFIHDVQPSFDSVKLSIAPLRWGAGVKGKINQSMGLGVPVVATSIAVEGMDLTNREDVVIADTPASFADAIVELYENEPFWSRLSENSVAKTRATYSRETATAQLSRLMSDTHAQSPMRASQSEMLAAPAQVIHSPAEIRP